MWSNSMQRRLVLRSLLPTIFGGLAPGSVMLPAASWNRFNFCLAMSAYKQLNNIWAASRGSATS